LIPSEIEIERAIFVQAEVYATAEFVD